MREKQIAKKQADFGAYPRQQFAERFLSSVIIQPYGPSCLPRLLQCKEMSGVWEADPGDYVAQRDAQALMPPMYHHFCLLSLPLPSCMTLGKFLILFYLSFPTCKAQKTGPPALEDYCKD